MSPQLCMSSVEVCIYHPLPKNTIYKGDINTNPIILINSCTCYSILSFSAHPELILHYKHSSELTGTRTLLRWHLSIEEDKYYHKCFDNKCRTSLPSSQRWAPARYQPLENDDFSHFSIAKIDNVNDDLYYPHSWCNMSLRKAYKSITGKSVPLIWFWDFISTLLFFFFISSMKYDTVGNSICNVCFINKTEAE